MSTVSSCLYRSMSERLDRGKPCSSDGVSRENCVSMGILIIGLLGLSRF